MALLVAGGLFFAVAEDVATGDPLVQLDAYIANWLHANATPSLTQFFLAVSLVHGIVPMLAYTAALAGFLVLQGDFYWARRVALIVPTGMLFNTVLKLAYQRLRPSFDHPILTLGTYSFPSGHAAGATLFYGLFALVLLSRLGSHGARAACVAIAALIVAVVAFSRLYLGVHYLSDVVAAACASVAWIAFGLTALGQLEGGARASASH